MAVRHQHPLSTSLCFYFATIFEKNNIDITMSVALTELNFEIRHCRLLTPPRWNSIYDSASIVPYRVELGR